MEDSNQLSPVSQVLASLGLTRDDLLRHADSMRDFLTTSKGEQVALPLPAPPVPQQPSPSPTPPVAKRKLSAAREPVTPARKSGSMEEVIERKRAQSRRERRSKRDREREDKSGGKLAPSEPEADNDAFMRTAQQVCNVTFVIVITAF